MLDTKPDPRHPKVVHEITAEELATKAGYSRPHTVHCGPGGIFLFSLGGANGNDGPGGVAPIDHDTFEVVGPWEFEHGLDPEDLLGRRFGHYLNFWSMSQRKLTQRVDLGDQHQLVFEVRPAHDPAKAWGFVGVVISVEDLSGSVWLWHRDGERWDVTKVITIPAEPADPELLPPALKPFGAVPPLVTDIDLSVDDRWLYVSCWGTGELKQYDVSDVFNPRETGSVRLGGIVGRQPHPGAPDQPLGGGPQMVEVSRDGTPSRQRAPRRRRPTERCALVTAWSRVRSVLTTERAEPVGCLGRVDSDDAQRRRLRRVLPGQLSPAGGSGHGLGRQP